MGEQWAEASRAASDDMGRAVAAADVISRRIKEVQVFLNPGTWSGAAADNWMGDWNSLYGQLLRRLNELPAAQAAVVKTVDRAIEAQQQRMMARAANGRGRDRSPTRPRCARGPNWPSGSRTPRPTSPGFMSQVPWTGARCYPSRGTSAR